MRFAAPPSSSRWAPPTSIRPRPPPSAACAAKLGSTRQFYGTDDVVADMEALRKALGVEKWTLDGISYGSYVGERYALAYPQHVAKLVLDSVVPQVGETDLGLVEFHATARVLRSVCGEPCVADLAAVVRRDHDGTILFDALTTDSVLDPTYRRSFDVPAALHAARHGDESLLDAFVSGMHAADEAPADALDQGLHASTLCADWRYPWGDSSAPLAGRAAALRHAIARLPASAFAPFDASTASGNGFVRQCLPWAPTPPTPLPHGKIRVPTLLVNGDHDLSTPLEWARTELELTTDGKLVVVPARAIRRSRARAATPRVAAVARFLLG